MANPSGVPAIPAWSQGGTTDATLWNNMGRLLGSTLPAAGPMVSTATRRQRPC